MNEVMMLGRHNTAIPPNHEGMARVGLEGWSPQPRPAIEQSWRNTLLSKSCWNALFGGPLVFLLLACTFVDCILLLTI